ncbi:hypothetical protein [Polymorphum gilvum]|uniref:Tetratricopeptide repeat protein n=1 Tax=Polymorphum gilvum (strain LMG 25793 / CGMCC 1.9160 / SL003B-26A1) TaxID=991905 RepID=F2IVF7_POLGS|nr:hypothetical protein [Polymorphum gilvum]ADZ72675.1 hypothetical protein SL003B_4258 [Polymorphum gilvum SL003B-26A1]
MTADPSSPSASSLSVRLAATRPGRLLVVVFSQVRVPEGKFGLERLFANTGHNCLFLNDCRSRWYLGQDAAIDAAVEEARAGTGASGLVYYGSSMGGYGALAAGLRRGDGTVHAFGPELVLGRAGSQSARYGIAREIDGALVSRLSRAAPAHPLHLYFGILDPDDAAGAAAALACLPRPNLAVHLLRSCHASHDHLYSLNVVRKIITTFRRDPAVEIVARGLAAAADPAVLAAFARLAEALADGRAVDPGAVEALAAAAPDNPGPLRLLAEALAARGDYAAAVAALEAAERLVASDPVLATLPKRWRKEMPLRRAGWLIELGRQEEAAAVLADAVARFPADPRFDALAARLGAAPG